MATTETIHGQVSYVDENGNVHILNGETTAADVLVEKSTNKQAESGQSAIPSDVDTLQKLADRFGSLAFKSKISTSDIPENLVLDDFSGGNTSDTGFVSAKAGKDLDKRLKKYEGEDLVAVLNTDSYGAMLPQSEINDAFLSRSLTWSSNKINDQFIAMSNRTDGIAKELQQNNVSLSKQVSQLNSRINDMVSAGEQPGCQGDCAHCEQSETCCFNEIKDLRTICTDLEDRIKMLLAVEQAASSGSETVPVTKGSDILDKANTLLKSIQTKTPYKTAGEAIRTQLKAIELKLENLDAGVNSALTGATMTAMYTGGMLSAIQKYPSMQQEESWLYIRRALNDIRQLLELSYLSDYETDNMVRRALKENRERIDYAHYDMVGSMSYVKRMLDEITEKIAYMHFDMTSSMDYVKRMLDELAPLLKQYKDEHPEKPTEVKAAALMTENARMIAHLGDDGSPMYM